MNSTSRKTELRSRLFAALRRVWAGDALDLPLPELMGVDGAPLGSMEQAADALWQVAEADLSPQQEGAFLAGVNALWRLAGDPGTLPPGEGARIEALRQRVVAWGLDTASPEPMAGKTWACWAFRATGLAVGHARVGGQPARIFLDARSGGVRWDVGGTRILEGDGLGTGGALAVARVDGRKMRMVAEGPGWRRELLAQGQRLVVRDRGATDRWRIAGLAGFVEESGKLLGRVGRLGIEIKGEGRLRRDGAWLCAEGGMLSVELR